MRFVTLKYFKSGSGLCFADFEEKDKSITLNVNLISEISYPEKLRMLGGGNVDSNYFYVKMNNGIMYNCRETEYKQLINKLIILNENSNILQ